jgi:hypothetical protein
MKGIGLVLADEELERMVGVDFYICMLDLSAIGLSY